MDEEPDHYATLQVAPTADAAVIAAAYRALARRYHPDLAGADGEAMMRRLNAAWEVLGDPERRAAYDRQRGGRSPTDEWATPRTASDAAAPTEPRSSDRQAAASAAREPSPFGPAGPPPGRPQGSVLAFGLFRGWSLGEIARVDPGYLEWLEGKPEGRPYLAEIDATLRAIGWRRPPPGGGQRTRSGRRWRFGSG